MAGAARSSSSRASTWRSACRSTGSVSRGASRRRTTAAASCRSLAGWARARGRMRVVGIALFALIMSLNGFVFGVVSLQLVPLLEAAGLAGCGGGLGRLAQGPWPVRRPGGRDLLRAQPQGDDHRAHRHRRAAGLAGPAAVARGAFGSSSPSRCCWAPRRASSRSSAAPSRWRCSAPRATARCWG